MLMRLQWDMLDITRGLAGWRLVAASTPECPPDSDSPDAAVLAFQLAGGLAQLTLTLCPADAGEGAAVAQAGMSAFICGFLTCKVATAAAHPTDAGALAPCQCFDSNAGGSACFESQRQLQHDPPTHELHCLDAGSSSCLEVDEDAACVPAELRGLAAAVIGVKQMGASSWVVTYSFRIHACIHVSRSCLCICGAPPAKMHLGSDTSARTSVTASSLVPTPQ
jgi:hypothetical protein